MRRPGITQALRLMHTYLVSCKVHDLWYLPWLFYELNQDFLVFCCIIVALILPDNSGFQPNYLLSENRMRWKKIQTKPGNYYVIRPHLRKRGVRKMCCISSKRAVHYRILMQALHLAGRFVKGDGLLNCCCIWTNKILLFNSKTFFFYPFEKNMVFCYQNCSDLPWKKLF